MKSRFKKYSITSLSMNINADDPDLPSLCCLYDGNDGLPDSNAVSDSHSAHTPSGRTHTQFPQGPGHPSGDVSSPVFSLSPFESSPAPLPRLLAPAAQVLSLLPNTGRDRRQLILGEIG